MSQILMSGRVSGRQFHTGFSGCCLAFFFLYRNRRIEVLYIFNSIGDNSFYYWEESKMAISAPESGNFRNTGNFAGTSGFMETAGIMKKNKEQQVSRNWRNPLKDRCLQKSAEGKERIMEQYLILRTFCINFTAFHIILTEKGRDIVK